MTTNEIFTDMLHRQAMEQEQAIKRARETYSMVVMFVGTDRKRHYKASCDLTQEDIERFPKEEQL